MVVEDKDALSANHCPAINPSPAVGDYTRQTVNNTTREQNVPKI